MGGLTTKHMGAQDPDLAWFSPPKMGICDEFMRILPLCLVKYR